MRLVLALFFSILAFGQVRDTVIEAIPITNSSGTPITPGSIMWRDLQTPTHKTFSITAPSSGFGVNLVMHAPPATPTVRQCLEVTGTPTATFDTNWEPCANLDLSNVFTGTTNSFVNVTVSGNAVAGQLFAVGATLNNLYINSSAVGTGGLPVNGFWWHTAAPSDEHLILDDSRGSFSPKLITIDDSSFFSTGHPTFALGAHLIPGGSLDNTFDIGDLTNAVYWAHVEGHQFIIPSTDSAAAYKVGSAVVIDFARNITWNNGFGVTLTLGTHPTSFGSPAALINTDMTGGLNQPLIAVYQGWSGVANYSFGSYIADGTNQPNAGLPPTPNLVPTSQGSPVSQLGGTCDTGGYPNTGSTWVNESGVEPSIWFCDGLYWKHLPYQLYTIDWINQTASIASSTMATTPGAGLFRVSSYISQTLACSSGSVTLTPFVGYTDNSGSQSVNLNGITTSSVAGAEASSSIVFWLAGGSISYGVGGGICAGGKYDVHIFAQRIY